MVGYGADPIPCVEKLAERGARLVAPDGTGLEVFASGVRNTVGFDWHPQTREIWFTDNGRDNLGDDVPTDELNTAPKKGLHFGFPFCHQGDILDPEFGKGHACGEFAAPLLKTGPHVAGNGVEFYTGSMFPAEYKNAAFIARNRDGGEHAVIGVRIPAQSAYALDGYIEGASVLLTIGAKAKAPSLPVDHLAAWFGFTPAEALLAASLADGDTIRDFAIRRGVTENAVRFLMKGVLRKAGVADQARLVAALRGLPLAALDGRALAAPQS